MQQVFRLLLMQKNIFILLVMLFSLRLLSQTREFIYHTIPQQADISSRFCYTMLKDSRGIVWTGSLNGLNRFDGQHFYRYTAGKDSNSLINNEVIDLCEDKEGNIWGATASGIFRYEVRQGKFINYATPGYDYVRRHNNIICDKNGTIWATGEWTILRFNKQANQFVEIGPLTRHKDSLRSYSVRQNGLVEDPSGRGLWMATRSGLHFYNTEEDKFYSYKNRQGDSLFVKHGVAALSLTSNGYFWFFDNVTKDVIAFDPVSYKILHRINVGSMLPEAIGQTLFEDSNHLLWLSTWNAGIAAIDYRKGSVAAIKSDDNNPFSFPGRFFWDIWEDADKTLWFGTGSGMSLCNYSKEIYSRYPFMDNIRELKTGTLGSITIDPRDDSWWFASDEAPGLIHFLPKSGIYTFYDYKKAAINKSGQLPGPTYFVSFIDGQPYACTHTGVWRLEEKSGKVIPFEKQFDSYPFLPYTVVQPMGDFVWFLTKQGHLKWNKITNTVKLVTAPSEMLPDSQRVSYNLLYPDNQGNHWYLPAAGWLARISSNNEVYLQYYIKDKVRELSSYIISVQHDKKGIQWLASISAGLYRHNTATGDIQLLGREDGIEGFLRSLVIDTAGRIWMASFNSFSVYNPKTGSVSTYKLPLYDNEINYNNNFALLKDGSVLATLYRDIIRFMPDRLEQKPVLIDPPLISQVLVSGKEILSNSNKHISLAPDENEVTFSFGSLISNDIFPYMFQYRLNGFDQNWKDADPDAQAKYSNLDPGRYTFRVKVVSKNKLWETEERTIDFTIRTPFFKTGWFRLLVISLVVGSLLLFYRMRLNKHKQILTLETKAQQLEKEKMMVQYEGLKQQLNPHFLFNSLTSLSGLIETDQQVAGKFLEQMSDMYRYILKNGDMETVLLKDELKFVQLYINLQKTRFNKGLLVNIDVPEEYHHLKIAPVTLQNMIENAIKHNVIDRESPLVIEIYTDDQDYIVIKNNLQRKSNVETSNKKGLLQFITLYSYLSSKSVIVNETENFYAIKIPLV